MRASGLVLGYLLDRVLGDPRRFHPVAGFGRWAAFVERYTYRDSKAAGAVHVGALLGDPVVAGFLVDRWTRKRPVLRLVSTAAVTWAVLGGRSLAREAGTIAAQLEANDLAAAREQITHLVSRDPSSLDSDGIARAATESIAENTSDAVIAPLFWGGVLGLPGLLGLRVVNTLDAMIGYRNERYQHFGWAAAKLDDVLGWIPARLGAAITWLVSPAFGGSRDAVLQASATDSRQHPSPNGGVIEGAFAGALGVTLGGSNKYGGVVEDRGTLGNGPNPNAETLQRAVTLMNAVSVGALVVAAGIAWCVTRRKDS